MSSMMVRKTEAEAKGLFIYTLLDDEALEAVDHLEHEEYAVEGGELVLYKLLKDRSS